jgi:hypothetical protein
MHAFLQESIQSQVAPPSDVWRWLKLSSLLVLPKAGGEANRLFPHGCHLLGGSICSAAFPLLPELERYFSHVLFMPQHGPR